MAEEIVINYETLFELLRLERSKTELQKLPASFSDDAAELLQRSRPELSSSDGDRSKKQMQHNNTIKILAELYERREKKIVNMALDKSKTKSAIIDFSRLLEKERELFDSVLDILDNYRERMQMLLKQEDFFDAGELKEKAKEPDIGEESADSGQRALKTIRFLSAIPKFLGEDLTEYGPFDEEDIASLPSRLAEILISRKRAQEISNQPM
ncbi:hypothetical protein GF323_00015 [Candidatus Woesearchaeota archaeon]|nr:hypothetical protein [Candidatus Woesearchaeota archaeon]